MLDGCNDFWSLFVDFHLVNLYNFYSCQGVKLKIGYFDTKTYHRLSFPNYNVVIIPDTILKRINSKYRPSHYRSVHERVGNAAKVVQDFVRYNAASDDGRLFKVYNSLVRNGLLTNKYANLQDFQFDGMKFASEARKEILKKYGLNFVNHFDHSIGFPLSLHEICFHAHIQLYHRRIPLEVIDDIKKAIAFCPKKTMDYDSDFLNKRDKFLSMVKNICNDYQSILNVSIDCV